MKTLSLIIPIYNGAPYIADTMLELIEFVSEQPWLRQVIMVDDGSTDDTEKILKAYRGKKYPFELVVVGYSANNGKAYAIRYAISYLKPVDAVAFTDVELPYGLTKFSQALQQLEEYDFVVGSRFDTVVSKPQYTKYRGIATKLFKLLLPRQVRSIKDTQCGFKIFRTYIFRQLFSNIKTFRWVFDIELFVIATQQGISFTSIPVKIKEKCLRKNGGVSFFKHGIYILLDLLKIHKNIAFKKYD